MRPYFILLLLGLFLWQCESNTEAAEEAEMAEELAADAPMDDISQLEDLEEPSAAPPVKAEVSKEDNTADITSPLTSQVSSAATNNKVATKNKATGNQEQIVSTNKTTPTVISQVNIEEEGIAPYTDSKPEVEAASTSGPPDHGSWNDLLQRYVNPRGNVDYAGFKQAEDELQAYLDLLARQTPQSDWSRNQAMAYWINAYNAFTVKLILNHYPVASIKDIYGGNPWDRKWITLDGTPYSLNQIENDILRPRYQDARIHFAVNCAAASCPPLYNRAFTSANLNATLDRLTRNFINNKAYNDLSAERVEVSKIFDWYGSDFGDVREYLRKYTDTEITADTQLAFKEYSWNLNKQ